MKPSVDPLSTNASGQSGIAGYQPETVSTGVEDDEISLLDLMVVVMDNLWLLILGPIFAGLIALGVAFQMTPVYTAKTTVIPPGQPSGGGASAVLGQLGGLAALAGGALSPAAGKHMAYLDSDLIRDELIKRFDLQKRYETEFLSQTRAALKGATKITDDKKSGLVAIEFTDKDPVFAANVANAYVEILSRLLGEAALDDARLRRAFLEKQLAEAMRKSYQSPQVRDAMVLSLVQQTESARLEEMRPNPNIVQVDVAQAPDLKSGPKRALIAVITSLATGFLLLLFVFVRQALANAGQDKESVEKINRIRRRLFLAPLPPATSKN
jgi:uncharacterized protein involved in exopolysaccharide biosynthesis